MKLPEHIHEIGTLKRIQENLQGLIDIKTQLVDEVAVKQLSDTIEQTIGLSVMKSPNEVNKLLKRIGGSLLWHLDHGAKI